MSVDRRTLLALLAALPLPARAQQQGFAGLGGSGEGYAEVRPGHRLRFPRDHGAHPDFRIEWWYLTANLEDATGAPCGLQFTLFRQAAAPPPQRQGWQSQQFWLGHAAVTDATWHLHAEKLARGGVGQAGARAAPFEAWIDDWRLASTGAAFSPLELRVEAPGFGFELHLETDAPMVLQGADGYSRKSERGQASYYVSQPFFAAEGRLRFGDETRRVSGRAWMDREWSSQPLAPDQEGWDWFSLHLSGGDKLMLFRLRHADGRHFFAGNRIASTGESTPVPAEAITMTPLSETRVGGRSLPTSWRLRIDGSGIDVTARALNPKSWNATGFAYWEGPVLLDDGAGIGYLEMTGY